MADRGGVVIAGPSLFVVQWSCRRCGHQGGVARTNIPVGRDWTEPMMRALFESLKRKLVRVHMQAGCIATVEDFALAPYVPATHRLRDRI